MLTTDSRPIARSCSVWPTREVDGGGPWSVRALSSPARRYWLATFLATSQNPSIPPSGPMAPPGPGRAAALVPEGWGR